MAGAVTDAKRMKCFQRSVLSQVWAFAEKIGQMTMDK